MRRLNTSTDEYYPMHKARLNCLLRFNRSSPWQCRLEILLNLLPIKDFEALEMKRKVEKLSRQQFFSPKPISPPRVCKGHADRHGQETEAALYERLKGLGLA